MLLRMHKCCRCWPMFWSQDHKTLGLGSTRSEQKKICLKSCLHDLGKILLFTRTLIPIIQGLMPTSELIFGLALLPMLAMTYQTMKIFWLQGDSIDISEPFDANGQSAQHTLILILILQILPCNSIPKGNKPRPTSIVWH